MKLTWKNAGVMACLYLLTCAASVHAADIVETAAKTKGFSTLVAAAKAAGLVETLQGEGPFTVFAPNDDAFAKLPKGTVEELLKPENRDRLTAVLTYHVVPGMIDAKAATKANTASTVLGQRLSISNELGRLQVNESKVVATDIRCDNGIIHVIDNVLLPAEKTIPGIAKEAGTFNTLLAAVSEAGLAKTLTGTGPFTVFAPSDDAFAKLPKGTVSDLLKPENREQLVSILTYHVVPGRIFSDQILEQDGSSTVQGQPVAFTLSANGISVNESSVIAANIQASNGVIHVIDSVLLPKTLDENGAMKLLQTSVNKGAKAFNSGDYHACCRVYSESCNQIISQGQTLPEEVEAVLQISLKRASGTKSEKEKAWVLRHGIDLAYFALSH